jgi:hypothetical protein
MRQLSATQELHPVHLGVAQSCRRALVPGSGVIHLPWRQHGPFRCWRPRLSRHSSFPTIPKRTCGEGRLRHKQE